jgi:hypothetical protein
MRTVIDRDVWQRVLQLCKRVLTEEEAEGADEVLVADDDGHG